MFVNAAKAGVTLPAMCFFPECVAQFSPRIRAKQQAKNSDCTKKKLAGLRAPHK